MVWRTITPEFAGDTQHVGGTDYNKIMKLFNGIADVDSVDINSPLVLRYGKTKIANQSYNGTTNISGSVLRSLATTVDRTVTLPDSDIIVPGLTNTATFENKIYRNALFDTYFDLTKQSMAPTNPPAGVGRFFIMDMDSNNEAVFVIIKRNGAFNLVRLT